MLTLAQITGTWHALMQKEDELKKAALVDGLDYVEKLAEKHLQKGYFAGTCTSCLCERDLNKRHDSVMHVIT